MRRLEKQLEFGFVKDTKKKAPIFSKRNIAYFGLGVLAALGLNHGLDVPHDISLSTTYMPILMVGFADLMRENLITQFRKIKNSSVLPVTFGAAAGTAIYQLFPYVQ